MSDPGGRHGSGTGAAVVLLAALAALAGCSTSTGTGARGCETDDQCGELRICEVASGTCLCTDDAACDATELCNARGRCQPITGCDSNADCPEDDTARTICDTTAAQCLALSASVSCVLDSQCPFGSYCGGGKCEAGCRDAGDCPLGQPCIGGQCDPRPAACTDNSFCDQGDLCGLADNTCRPHRSKATLCSECQSKLCFTDADCGGLTCDQPNPLQVGSCAECGGAFCLIEAGIAATPCTSDAQCSDQPGAHCVKAQCLDDGNCDPGTTCVGADPGTFFTPPTLGACSAGACGAFYCGTDACNATDDVCPSGYTCGPIRSVSVACTAAGGECQGGRACQIGGENNQAGFCSCIVDGDCPLGAFCENPGPNGACIIGASCGPSSGLICADLRP